MTRERDHWGTREPDYIRPVRLLILLWNKQEIFLCEQKALKGCFLDSELSKIVIVLYWMVKLKFNVYYTAIYK